MTDPNPAAPNPAAPGPAAVLVTGATGFIGRALCRDLAAAGFAVRAAVRRDPDPPLPPGVEIRRVGDIGPETDWSGALDGIEAVVHAAARVHVTRETAPDPEAAYRRINVAGSECLARQAAHAGVRRLVFLGSIGARYAEGAAPTPYQRSKREAEQALARVAAESGLEVVCLRPPLVYGPGAPGNAGALERALERGLPLPFGGLRNRRAFLHVDNLASAVRLCLAHPEAAGRTLALCDGTAISTADFARLLGAGAGRPARLFPCPPALLRFAGRLAGRPALAQSLLGDLPVDDREIREVLGWRPPHDSLPALTEAMRRARPPRRP